MILTRQELDRAFDDAPADIDSNSMVLTSKCHSKSGLVLRYTRSAGVIECECAKCGSHIANFGVISSTH